MKLPNIAYMNKPRKHSRTFHSEMIIKHLYLNIRPSNAVVAMSDSIDN